jgi:ribosomal protein S18 acetylase RimI-like enzyme
VRTPPATVVGIRSPQERSRICAEILRELPGWFGLADSVKAYVRDVADLPVLAVATEDGSAAGFLALKDHGPSAVEIYVMGVRPELHGRGLGTLLVTAAEDDLRTRGVEFLHVKTLGPSHPSEGYARTRTLYEAHGFRPLEEIHGLWAEGNPCLVLVKHLRCR